MSTARSWFGHAHLLRTAITGAPSLCRNQPLTVFQPTTLTLKTCIEEHFHVGYVANP